MLIQATDASSGYPPNDAALAPYGEGSAICDATAISIDTAVALRTHWFPVELMCCTLLLLL